MFPDTELTREDHLPSRRAILGAPFVTPGPDAAPLAGQHHAAHEVGTEFDPIEPCHVPAGVLAEKKDRVAHGHEPTASGAPGARTIRA